MATGMDTARADEALERLQSEIGAWHGNKVQNINISAGFALASDTEGITIEQLVNNADNVMYDAKDEYYRTSGEDRRRNH